MEQLTSDTCTDRRVAAGCVRGVSVGVSVRKSGSLSQ